MMYWRLRDRFRTAMLDAVRRGRVARGSEGDRGDTLIEILITLVIVGLAGIAILGAYTMSINATADYRNVATLNTVLTDASQSAISQIQQQTSPFFTPCVKGDPTNASVVNTYKSDVVFNAPSGYSVAVTAVEYLNGTTFTSACSTPTAPQEVFATATNTRTFASASINFVVDDRGGAAPLTSSVITIRSTAPTNPSLSSTYAPTATATSGDVVVVSIDSTSSSVCYIAGGVVHFTSAGTCLVDFNDAGSANLGPAVPMQQPIVILPSQTIAVTWTPPTNAGLGGQSSAAPTGTAPGGTVVASIGSTSTSACSIVPGGAGLVGFGPVAGTCVVDLNDAGGGGYAAAPQVALSFTVWNTGTITWSAPANNYPGGSYTPIASATSGDTVSIAVDPTTSSVCSMSGTLVKFNAAASRGSTCLLDFNDPGNAATYYPMTVQTQSITLMKTNVITTSWTPTNLRLFGISTSPVTGSAPGGGVVVSIDTSSTSGCSISTANHKVSYLPPGGSCTLDFSQAGGGGYPVALLQLSFNY